MQKALTFTTLFWIAIVNVSAGYAAPENPNPEDLSKSNTEHRVDANTETNSLDETLRQTLRDTINRSDSFMDRFDAEVWLTATSAKLTPYIKNPAERLHVLQHVHRAATKANLEPELVLAVIQIESAFNPYALSRVGAQGLMQVMPFWKKEIGRPEDNLITLETNLQYGCTILKHYLDKEKGHFANALARYNGSYGSYTYSKKVIDAWLDYWR
jgi:soluble lytic murein transglycosylase-like protein